MKRAAFVLVTAALLAAGCVRSWNYAPLESFLPAGEVPPAASCMACHREQYESWKRYRHADPARMAIITVGALRECGACHGDAASHAKDPGASAPRSVAKMTRTEQNTLCGKCHYNTALFGMSAINPHDRHGLFMSVGLEGRKQQIACLDCHSGHRGRSDMLVSMKAHICFECHTSAIVTMGIFQPFNYLAFGYACQACHNVHGGSAAAQWTKMAVGVCVVCHFAGVALVN